MPGYVELFILCAILYWLFFPRATTMVDILAGSLQKVYSKWDSLSKPNLSVLSQDRSGMNERITSSGLDRHGTQLRKDQRQYKRRLMDQALHKTIFEDLPLEAKEIFSGDGLSIKNTQPYLDLPKEKTRPIMGIACRNCIPSLSNTLVGRAAHQYAIQNVLAVETQHKRNGYLTQAFCHLVSVWRQKAHVYPQVYTTVLDDERLKDAITHAADEEYMEVPQKSEDTYQKLLKKHEARAIVIINNMRTSISDFLLRVTSWLIYKLIPRFLMSVSTHPAQIKMLKSAGKSGLPLIFLPLHRSHLDYILISFILLCNDIQAPLVAAGDNLKIPFFGWLLRSLGAFFIKRRLDKVQGRRDVVYRAVLHTYMMECLRTGHNIEFFIEGGRTRTGKPCMPKGGLLSVIVDAYMDGTIADALLVPVSLNYEKLVDGNFVREQMGQPKEMETFGNAIKAIYNVLNSNYGMMRIDFHQPFSLMELVNSFQRSGKRRMMGGPVLPGVTLPILSDVRGDGRLTVQEKAENFHQTPSSASLYGTDICHEEHRQLVESIARHVIYDCTQATAVMSTNAVAFLLLTRYRQGVPLPVLVRALDELRADMKWAHRDVGFSGESVDVIVHALGLLGPGLVLREKKELPLAKGQTEPDVVLMITPVTMLPNVIELSYYSNSLLSHYVIDAVVATALFSLLGDAMRCKEEDNEVLYVRHDQLIQSSLQICDILQYEFIFAKPCQEIEALVSDAVDNFKIREVFVQEHEALDEDRQWSQRVAKTLEEEEGDFSDGEDNTYHKGVEYQFFRTKKVLDHLEFLHGLLRPLIDVYAVSALSLRRLVGRQLTEREYVQEILAETKACLESGFATYGETMAVDPIKCSLKLFEHWQVLECHTEERVKLYYLPEKYDSESEVTKIFNLVNQFKWLDNPEQQAGVVESEPL